MTVSACLTVETLAQHLARELNARNLIREAPLVRNLTERYLDVTRSRRLAALHVPATQVWALHFSPLALQVDPRLSLLTWSWSKEHALGALLAFIAEHALCPSFLSLAPHQIGLHVGGDALAWLYPVRFAPLADNAVPPSHLLRGLSLSNLPALTGQLAQLPGLANIASDDTRYAGIHAPLSPSLDNLAHSWMRLMATEFDTRLSLHAAQEAAAHCLGFENWQRALAAQARNVAPCPVVLYEEMLPEHPLRWFRTPEEGLYALSEYASQFPEGVRLQTTVRTDISGGEVHAVMAASHSTTWEWATPTTKRYVLGALEQSPSCTPEQLQSACSVLEGNDSRWVSCCSLLQQAGIAQPG